MPITITADGAVVPVTLNGRTAQGVLDTGASHTVVDAAFARDSGLTSQAPVTVGGAFGSASGAIASEARLRIGDRAVTVTPIIVDLGASGLGAPVIIGADFFRAGPVRFDFGAGVLQMLGEIPAGHGDGHEIPLSRSSGAILQLPVQVDGEPVLLGLDTGSQTALTLPATARDHLGGSTWVTADISGWRIHGTRSAVLAIGSTEFSRVPASVNDEATDGLVGLPVLKRFDITLDMANARVWIAPLASAREPFPRDRLGLAMLPGARGLEVIHVALNSPASRAGFAVGDRIVRVGEEAVVEETAPRLLRIGQGPAGATLELETASGAVRSVELANYF